MKISRALPFVTISRAVGAPIHGAPMGSRRWFNSSAPKGQAIAAQGNALGLNGENVGALLRSREANGRPNS
jgi:hypothetical protein